MLEDLSEQAVNLGHPEIVRRGKKVDVSADSERVNRPLLSILRTFGDDEDFLAHVLDCRQ